MLTVRKLTLVFLIFTLMVMACGGDGDEKEEVAPAAGAAGDAAQGEALFNQTVIGSQPGCITCHSLEPDKVLVGPSLAGVGTRAGTRVSGQSAEEYLRESILDTDAYTVDGFSAGVMPAALADELSEQQVADLVAFLLTLK
jgi:nitric oxide reductase subunit C